MQLREWAFMYQCIFLCLNQTIYLNSLFLFEQFDFEFYYLFSVWLHSHGPLVLGWFVRNSKYKPEQRSYVLQPVCEVSSWTTYYKLSRKLLNEFGEEKLILLVKLDQNLGWIFILHSDNCILTICCRTIITNEVSFYLYCNINICRCFSFFCRATIGLWASVRTGMLQHSLVSCAVCAVVSVL